MYYPICTESEAASAAPSVGDSVNNLPGVPDFPAFASHPAVDTDHCTEEVPHSVSDDGNADVSDTLSFIGEAAEQCKPIRREWCCFESLAPVVAVEDGESLPQIHSVDIAAKSCAEHKSGRVEFDASAHQFEENVRSYECLFCNILVKGADICESCSDPCNRPVVPARRRRTVTWR